MNSISRNLVQFKHNFKLNLGQNFLVNESIANEIIKNINIRTKKILEIGPGGGALTEKLVSRNFKIVAVEKDVELKNFLTNTFLDNSNIQFIFDDFISYNLPDKFDTVIGNLPYQYIKFIFLKLISIDFKEGIFMISENYKKELLADISDSYYTIISFLINFFFKVDILIENIPKEAFVPKSTVISDVIRLSPRYEFNKYENIRYIFKNIDKHIYNIIPQNHNIPKEIYKKQIKNLELGDLIYIDYLKEILFSSMF